MATSLCDRSSGMVASCTGVHQWKPPRSRASNTCEDCTGDSSKNLCSVSALFLLAAASRGVERAMGGAAVVRVGGFRLRFAPKYFNTMIFKYYDIIMIY
jgi:hypothetical protein